MTRFVAMFDILGFRELIRARSLRTLEKIGTEFVEVAKGIRHSWYPKWRSRIEVRIVQDTVIIVSRAATDRDFYAIVVYAQTLIRESLTHNLALRGAITRGEVSYNPHMVVGKAIARAYEMEQQQDWIGCWVDDCCLEPFVHKTASYSHLEAILEYYCVPLKGGFVRREVVIDWVKYAFDDTAESVARVERAWEKLKRRTLTSKQCTWDVRRKILNTDDFVSYIRNMPDDI